MLIRVLQHILYDLVDVILGVRWPNVITNVELLGRTNMETIETSVKRRKWPWIGHTFRRESSHVARQALNYHPQGKRKVGTIRSGPRKEPMH